MSPRRRSWPPAPEPLPVPAVDNHAHLDIEPPELDPDERPYDVEQALRLAASVNVTHIVQAGYDLASSRWTVEMAKQYDRLHGAVAIHPNDAPGLARQGQLDAALAEIETLARDPSVVAVGESGLDHFRTEEAGWELQEYSLRAHIEIAKRVGKPLQIHDRDAHEDVLRVLADAGAPDRVVFHSFSADAAVARIAVARGYILSFSGTVTFRNAPALREALVEVPANALLVETDAPFLTPEPFRGQPNSSYLVPVTLRAMAQVRGVSVADLAAATTATAERVYDIRVSAGD